MPYLESMTILLILIPKTHTDAACVYSSVFDGKQVQHMIVRIDLNKMLKTFI